MSDLSDFLGVDLPKKFLQGVAAWKDVKKDKKDLWPYILQNKHDGVCIVIAVLDDFSACAFSRTGKRFMNTDKLISDFIISGGTGLSGLMPGLYIGELCCDSCKLEELSGITNPNRKADLSPVQKKFVDELYVAFFDFLNIEDIGISRFTYIKRLTLLADRVMIKNKGKFFTVGSVVAHNIDELMFYFNWNVDKGEEGVVVKPDVHSKSGFKGWRSMKMVRKIEYDLMCVGYEYGKEGTKRFNQITNLIFAWKDGREIKVDLGKGYTEFDRKAMYDRRLALLGKVYRVTAMKESSNGVLRLPKVMEERIDKEVGDF